MSSVITGWGACRPPAVLTNDDLSQFMETSDEWIRTRTGMHERRVSHVGVSELAAAAGSQALATAGIDAADIDGILLATTSPESLIPGTASLVQKLLGNTSASSVDVNAGCCGFAYALTQAHGLLTTGVHQRILVIGAERLTFYLDWTDRSTAVLFGDGAGAVVLEAREEQGGILSAELGCNPGSADALRVRDFGTSMPRYTAEPSDFSLHFDGQEVFRQAVRNMRESLGIALERAGHDAGDLDWLVPHQANARIIEAVGKRAGIPPEKVFMNLQRYGNTSSASIPLALFELLEEGRVEPGQLLGFVAFGAGLTRAALVLRWGDKTGPAAKGSFELPPCTQTARELIQHNLAAQQNRAS